jgi:excisionase family DNA binding protein
LDSSDSRRLYDGQSIKQDTSEVFRTEEPETCILVVKSAYGTLLSLIEATDADRVAAEKWKTDEHLDDIFIVDADGWQESLGDFVTPTTEHMIDSGGRFEGVTLQGSAETIDEQRLLYDRKTAARLLSISVRALDRFIANRAINTRRIGSRVLIPRSELQKFARADHIYS